MNESNKRERACEICKNIFLVKYPCSKCRSCPNIECRKQIRSLTTKKYFEENPDTKKAISDKIKEKWKDEEYKNKMTVYIKEKRNYKKENHPSWGMKRNDTQKKNISDGILENKEKENIDKTIQIINTNFELFKDQLFEKKEKICTSKGKNFKEKKKKIEELKKKKGNICVDCGCNDYLEFDHISNKTNNIFKMKLEEMDSEAEKCELRCRLCHTIKSHKENYKNTQIERSIDNQKNTYNRTLRERRREYISKIKKEIGGCQNCKYQNDDMPYLFDFDHIDSSQKKRGIAWHVSHGSSIKLIHEELEKCILLCKKCHYKRTAVQLDFNRILK